MLCIPQHATRPTARTGTNGRWCPDAPLGEHPSHVSPHARGPRHAHDLFGRGGIGVSLYHWGLAYPWGENELPRAGTFEKLIRGVDTGAHAGGATVPDLYTTYADDHDKPLAVIETAILYDPSATSGPSEKDLKSAWFEQVFSDATRTAFPRVGMLNWFEWRKQESEVGRVIDWRLASDPALARSLLDSAPEGWLHFAGE